MADILVEIEVELRRSVLTDKDAGDQRKRLKAKIQQLGPNEAAVLLKRLLTWDGSRLPQDFRRPARETRLALLLLLVERLGTQTAAKFYLDLKGEGARAPDQKLLQGLRMMFPDYAKTQRDAFLTALKAGRQSSSTPSVLLEFRNTGFFSPDNRAKGSRMRDPEEPNDPQVVFRLGPSPITGKNKMEIQGTVIGHRPDASYKFRRTIEQKTWYRAGEQWKTLNPPLPAGSSDDTHSEDEDDSPENDHIYSIDAPGFTGLATAPDLLSNIPVADRTKITEAVFMMNAIETVEVTVGSGPAIQSATVHWFTVTWLEKSGTSWQRKSNMNSISKGSIADLGIGSEPPTTF